MKSCILCNSNKEISDFYKHKEMSDGHLNKCKSCCKEQASKRMHKFREDPMWIEKEKERAREKYHRLGYRDKHKPSKEQKKAIISRYIQKYPEKQAAKEAISKYSKKKGFQLHHWSYNKEHYRDVIELLVSEHNLLHRHMNYDQERKMYRDKAGHLLGTKESHLELLNKLNSGL